MENTNSADSINTSATQQENYFKSLFNFHVCDLPTHTYLLNKNLVTPLDPTMQSHFRPEALDVQSRLTAGSPPRACNPALRVALTNVWLNNYGGAALWTADTAKYLKSLGVDVIVFSPALGPVAEMIRGSGITITSSIDEVEAFEPSILHVNHFESAKPLIDRLKGRAILINMIHGLLPRPGLPGYSGVDHYCCVSIHSKAKTHVLTGTAWSDIEMLPNFFDERRFTKISNPSVARRALIFSSRTPEQSREQLRSVLSPLGFDMDHVGYAGGEPTTEPERLLAEYDVIFAVGRSAIEALASGAHVVLWDFGIIGPAVTKDNFWSCVTSNFDLASNALPWRFVEDSAAADWIREQVGKISAVGRVQTTQLARAYLPLAAAGARLVNMYDRQLLGKRLP